MVRSSCARPRRTALRSLLAVLSCALVAAAFVISAPRAEASWVVEPDGGHVVAAADRAVVVWDAASKTEHWIGRSVFEGTATSFAYFVATPTKPDARREPDALLARVAALSPAGDHAADADDRVEEFELASFRAADPALKGWIDAHHYRAPLDAWLGPYASRGWYVTAVRMVPPHPLSPGRKTFAGPLLHFAFSADAPVSPRASLVWLFTPFDVVTPRPRDTRHVSAVAATAALGMPLSALATPDWVLSRFDSADGADGGETSDWVFRGAEDEADAGDAGPVVAEAGGPGVPAYAAPASAGWSRGKKERGFGLGALAAAVLLGLLAVARASYGGKDPHR